MDDAPVQYFWKLHRVNADLIKGLKTAIYILENLDTLTPEKRQVILESLKKTVSQSENAIGDETTIH
jgi:hypothetical protein